MSSTEYLNYEGGKFSKSKGVGVFGTDAKDTGIPADVWRFYIYYNRPEKSDALFTWKDFQEKVNAELIGNFGNLVNGRCSSSHASTAARSPQGHPTRSSGRKCAQAEAEIADLFEKVELREAFKKIFALSSLGNKKFQDGEPWKGIKEKPRGDRQPDLGTSPTWCGTLQFLPALTSPAPGQRMAKTLGHGKDRLGGPRQVRGHREGGEARPAVRAP